MSKIIKIEGNTVLIGNENGSITKVQLNDCDNFSPQVGDEVDIFNDENRVIVIKKNSSNQTNTINKHTVNKIAYCLLAFFLGGLGFHKFYANKAGAGILYLLFCWTTIPAIIGFIETIIALCKPADVNGNINV